MKGIEAFEEMISLLDDQPVVHANGFICRESFNVKDRRENFYMIGSMGLASAIGLGVALARPDKKTIIFDGDGNVFMAMGVLAMIAASAPKNLVHVTLDNEVYESTGSQATTWGTAASFWRGLAGFSNRSAIETHSTARAFSSMVSQLFRQRYRIEEHGELAWTWDLELRWVTDVR